MVCMLFTHIFDSKIGDHKGERNWSCHVAPQAWGVDAFVISMRFAVICLPKYLPVGGPRLHPGFPKIHSHLSRECPEYTVFWSTLVIVPVGLSYTHNNPMLLSGRSFNVEAHIFCTFRAEHAVPQKFRRCEIGCTCQCAAFVCDEVAADCNSDLSRIFFLGLVVRHYLQVSPFMSSRVIGHGIGRILIPV